MKKHPVFLIGLLLLLLFPSAAPVLADGGNDISPHFHTEITANHDTYTSGETALVTVKYRIDEGSASPGDYVIVSVPEDIASRAAFSVSPQHFSGVEDLGGGIYKLTFGENAGSALSGSMTIRVTTFAEEETTDAIEAGDSEKEITVLPSGGGDSGTGTYENEAIMKDGLGNEDMSFGGYDYSNEPPAQIGVFDSSVDHTFIYRIFVNRKNVSMSNVTIRDQLPDGMQFAGGVDHVHCFRIDPSSMTVTDIPVNTAQVTIAGQQLSVSLGDIDYPVEITYEVFVPAQNGALLRNHSEITYTQNGTNHKETSDYIARGNDYSAANGLKSVDKTIVSNDPGDQWVTYSIRFWNENGFTAGDISLTDRLNEYIDFLYADTSEYFDVTQDAEDPQVLHISNKKAIPGSADVSVTFVCDFSRVPAGYTVTNTVGGNTTTTKKEEPTPTPTPTETPEPTPTETPTSTPTETPEPAPTETPAPAPTETPTSTPTETPEPTPTETSEPSPTQGPKMSDVPTPTTIVKPSPSAIPPSEIIPEPKKHGPRPAIPPEGGKATDGTPKNRTSKGELPKGGTSGENLSNGSNPGDAPQSGAPATGDTANIHFFLLMAFCAAVSVLLLRRKYK